MEIARGPVPVLVAAAEAEARARGFEQSCSPGVGALLQVLAASRPAGLVGESGTGTGTGSAWLASGLGPAGRLVTVERDPGLAAFATSLFADDQRVRVLTGDWTLLRDDAPFDLFFCDGGGKRDAVEEVVSLLAPSGVLVLDDFAPATSWPPLYDGRPDDLRLAYLEHPDLLAQEVAVGPRMSCVVGVRR